MARKTRRHSRSPAAERVNGAGTLVIIGGREDKHGDMAILHDVVDRMNGGRLVVTTVATEQPAAVWNEYERIFRKLGVSRLDHLDIRDRTDAFSEANLKMVDDAGALFFTGGDQLRITSKLGGAPICDHMRSLLRRGGVIAGTSAGASAMSETMLVAGPSDESHRVDSVKMAPGLGFIAGVLIDQHFAERGRLGRLVGAVAQNPRLLGVGIDENTSIAAVGRRFTVGGAGAVYVVDGLGESYTNISEQQPNETMSVFDLRLHILGAGDAYDLEKRVPVRQRRQR
jgi:cyanophycinase